MPATIRTPVAAPTWLQDYNRAVERGVGGRLESNGAIVSRTRAITVSDTVGADDYLILADATAGAVTVTLPPAAASIGRQIVVKKTDAGGNNVIVDGDGAETVDGAANVTTAVQYATIVVHCDGAGWWVL